MTHPVVEAMARRIATNWVDGVYPLAFVDSIADALRKVAEDCAKIAEEACLVPPDGGCPTADETRMCEEAARRIRAAYCDATEG